MAEAEQDRHQAEERLNDLFEPDILLPIQYFAALKRKRFSHPSEETFANLLDFYRIVWEYEPRSFPIQWDADGRVLGRLAVIGPTRMAYQRVIPLVEVTAKILSRALSGPDSP